MKPTCWALADKAADLVKTFTLVQTGRAETLIHLYLTMSPLESCMHDKKVLRNFFFSQKLQRFLCSVSCFSKEFVFVELFFSPVC